MPFDMNLMLKFHAIHNDVAEENQRPGARAHVCSANSAARRPLRVSPPNCGGTGDWRNKTELEQIIAQTLVETIRGDTPWAFEPHAEGGMRYFALALSVQALLWGPASAADYRITRDYGGFVDEYTAKYTAIRDRGERVVIDGACDSACTLVLGIVPINRVCVTPRARLGFHMAYFEQAAADGSKVLDQKGTADVMSYYPESVKRWLDRHGGLTPDTKKVKNGPELWSIVDPCPEEVF
jgi:hypothetical protein